MKVEFQTRPAGLALALSAVLVALLLMATVPAGVRAQEEAPGQQAPAEEAPGEGPPVTPQPTESSAMQLYFYRDGELLGVPRSNIPAGGQMVEFAIKDLLEGPTDEEREQGYQTFIPPGVKLMYSTKSMVGSSYAVNLSGELMQLAGDHNSAVKALRQIAQTLREAAHTDEIKITINISDSDREADACQALGVSPSEVGLPSGGSEAGKGSRLWLYILIIVGAALAAEALLVPLFLRARRSERDFRETMELGGGR
jgi:hypothetical protein